LETIYQSCSIQERKKGYYIIKCQKIKLNAWNSMLSLLEY
jgi:hypothetical protein